MALIYKQDSNDLWETKEIHLFELKFVSIRIWCECVCGCENSKCCHFLHLIFSGLFHFLYVEMGTVYVFSCNVDGYSDDDGVDG